MFCPSDGMFPPLERGGLHNKAIFKLFCGAFCGGLVRVFLSLFYGTTGGAVVSHEQSFYDKWYAFNTNILVCAIFSTVWQRSGAFF